jgi:arylsulfatase A-like enzyme
VRIPLLARWPRSLAPRMAREPVAALVDVAPTLLDLAGIDVPSHMHGRSLAWALRGDGVRNDTQPDAAFIETGSGVGIRTATHLYGLPFEPGTRKLAAAPHYFFDLAADPYQLRNLAGTREQEAVAHELATRLRQWDARTPWMPQ